MNYGNYPDLSSVKKILVIKLRHHGDVLLTSPVFSNLPQVEIHAMVYKETVPMLEGHPSIAKFITYDRQWKKLGWLQRMAKELSLLKKIRKENYDLVINLTEGDRGAIAAFVSGAPLRVGFDPEKNGFLGKRKIYTHLVKNCRTPRHTVEKNLDALRKIGIFPSLEERDLFFSVPTSEQKGHILLHPVSRWKFKCWPTHLVAHLMEELHARGEKIVLTSSPDPKELEMVEEILEQVPHIPVINLAGKTSLKELGGLIASAKALICVDSVPLHMASALKTPVVALFGPSSELNWGPWLHPKARVVTQNYSCRPCFLDGCGGSKKSDCLQTLPVTRVLSALASITEAEEEKRSDPACHVLNERG